MSTRDLWRGHEHFLDVRASWYRDSSYDGARDALGPISGPTSPSTRTTARHTPADLRLCDCFRHVRLSPLPYHKAPWTLYTLAAEQAVSLPVMSLAMSCSLMANEIRVHILALALSERFATIEFTAGPGHLDGHFYIRRAPCHVANLTALNIIRQIRSVLAGE